MGAIKTIIISRTDKIGDFVVSIPSFATAKAMFPEAKIVALASKANRILAQNVPSIDEVITYDDYENFDDLVAKVKSYQPDVFIALVSDNNISKLAVKSGAKVRIGPHSKLWSFIHYNKGFRQKRSLCIKSEAAYNLDLIEHLDKERYEAIGGYKLERIQYSQDDAQVVANYLIKEGLNERNFILFNPFTGGSGSNLNVAQYAAIIEDILKAKSPYEGDETKEQDPNDIAQSSEALNDTQKRHALPHIVILGIKPNEPKIKEMLSLISEELHKRIHIFINEGSLLVAAALVDRCKVFIGPSTGITQIAGNYHKPAICFYSSRISNSHTRWELFGDESELPFTLDVNQLDPETKELKVLPDSMKQTIVFTILEEFYRY